MKPRAPWAASRRGALPVAVNSAHSLVSFLLAAAGYCARFCSNGGEQILTPALAVTIG